MSVTAEPAPARLSRLLSLVPWLTAHDGVPVAEAAAHFGVSADQLEKDLWLLVCCGLPGHGPEHLIDIQFWDEGGRIHVIEPQTLSSPVQLTADESVALVLGLRVLETLPGNHDRTTIRELIDILTSIAREHVGDSDRWVVESDISDSVRDIVEQSMASGSPIAIEYHAATKDEVTSRVVMPTEISVSDGRVFMHAWCLGARAHRTFRLDRIVSADIAHDNAMGVPPVSTGGATDERATSPDAINAPVTVRLSLASSARWLIDAYNLTVIEEDPDGATIVDWEIWSQEWLIRQVIEWGGLVHILEPPQWRNALLERLNELLGTTIEEENRG